MRCAMDMRAMEAAWRLVEEEFDAVDVFGEKGAAFLEYTGAKTCLHPLAAGLPVLAALAPLTNGGAIRLWADPTPLMCAVVLVNPPQSRKSQAAALVRDMGIALDEHVRASAHRAFEEKARGEGHDDETLAEKNSTLHPAFWRGSHQRPSSSASRETTPV